MGRLWARCGRGPSTLRRFQASSAISRSTVCAVRVIEATELLALDVFNAGGRQITLGDVARHYLHELRGHVDECRFRCSALPMSATPPRAVTRPLQRPCIQDRAGPVAPMADRLDKLRRQWEHLRTERERIENERRQREALADLDDRAAATVFTCVTCVYLSVFVYSCSIAL